jgi:hypothetical protein
MQARKHREQSQPAWWSSRHAALWEACLPDLRRDLLARRELQASERVARLGPDDALVQRHPTTPRNVSVERASAVPDDSWEVGTAWDQSEPALRFGVGARVQYARFEVWSEDLAALLREDWYAKQAPGTWERMKRTVRLGFETAGNKLR